MGWWKGKNENPGVTFKCELGIQKLIPTNTQKASLGIKNQKSQKPSLETYFWINNDTKQQKLHEFSAKPQNREDFISSHVGIFYKNYPLYVKSHKSHKFSLELSCRAFNQNFPSRVKK